MPLRSRNLLLCAAMLLLVGPPPSARGEAIEFVALHDFDDVELKIDGMRRKAYLIGLAPLDSMNIDDAQRKRRLRAARELAQRCGPVVNVVVSQDDRLGISLDAYGQHRLGFDHPWNPAKYPWCGTGWGAYNLNLCFLHRGWAKFEDNFEIDKRPQWKKLFEKLTSPARRRP